jgi:hypothetical protein
MVLLLIFSLAFADPPAAQEPHGNSLRGQALANADATKQEALHRLDTEAAYITQQHQQHFTDRMHAVNEDSPAASYGVSEGR